jgi:3',5'-cyclic AMP phosphodiesterase CpdA
MSVIDSFLHATDFHFWEIVRDPRLLCNKRIIGAANVWFRRRNEFHQDRAFQWLDAMAATGVHHAVLGGDFTSTSTVNEFTRAREWVEQLVARGIEPWLYPGNHDVYTFESVRHGRFEQFLGKWLPDAALPARAQLPGGTPMVFVPTACPNVLSSRGRIRTSELAAAGKLIASADEPLVVTGHYPVLERTKAYRIDRNRQLRNAAALRQLLGESGRKILYVSGHVHRFSYEADPRYPNLTHLTTGTFMGGDHVPGKQGEFSEIQIADGGFRVFRHRKTADWIREEIAPIQP